MDCGGKRSATPLFDGRPAHDATEAVRAAESGAALRLSPQSKITTAVVVLARHFRSHTAESGQLTPGDSGILCAACVAADLDQYSGFDGVNLYLLRFLPVNRRRPIFHAHNSKS